MDPTLEIQSAILARLKATSAVTALVPAERIRDIPKPEWAELDYVSIGPSDYRTDDFDCAYGGEVMIQIDCWSVRGLSPVRQIADAVRKALRGWEPTLTTNALVTFDHWRTDYVRNPPINQASIRYTAIVEQP